MLQSFTYFSAILLLAAACSSRPAQAVADGPRKTWDVGPVKFSLAETPEMVAWTPDSVKWSTAVQQSADNGQVLYYFLPKSPRGMGDSNIRVEFISRRLENCADAAQLFAWLKGVFVNPERNGKVTGEHAEVTTASGHQVQFLEITTPGYTPGNDPTSARMSGKTMVWAYLPYNDQWMVGFNLTVTEMNRKDYDLSLEALKKIVASYQIEPGAPKGGWIAPERVLPGKPMTTEGDSLKPAQE